MDKYPLITLIIPIYNVELYIERCLLSALNQTYQNIEIILIDDCGADDSMIIAKETLKNHPNESKVHIYTHEQNKGLSAARNTGIKYATGEYIFFLDSDDELILTAFESLIKELYHYNYDIIMAGVMTTDMQPYYITNSSKLKDYEIIESYYRGDIQNMAWNKLYKTKLIKDNKLQFKEGLIHEDYLWTYQAICSANSLRTINIPVYIYHIRENSLNTNFTLKNIKHYLYGYNVIKSRTFESYMTVPLSNDYLVDFAFGLTCLSIIDCKCSYRDYVDLNIFDHRIDYFKITQYKNKIKYIFFKFPLIIQYIILKFLK